MATPKHSTEHRQAEPPSLTSVTEQACQQMALVTEVAATLISAFESLQQVQQHSAQRTTLRLKQAASQLRQMSHPTELLGVQSTLWNAGVQELTQVTQEMTQSTLRLQGSLLHQQDDASSSVHSSTSRGARRAASTSTETAAEAMSEATSAASAATSAMLQSWASLMGNGASPWAGGWGSARH